MNMQPTSLWQLLLNNPEWALVAVGLLTIFVIGWQAVVGIVTMFVIGWQAVETRRAAQASQRSVVIMERQTKATEDSAKATQDTVTAIRQQVDLMERQTTATEKAAEAASENVEIFISRERARLRVDLLPFNITDKVGKTHLVNFVITMHGHTSAFITNSGASAYFLPQNAINVEDVSDQVMFPIPDLPSTIPPGNSPINTYSFLLIDEDDYADIISEIEKGRMVIGIRGFIKYRDVFDKPRETAFRYAWSLEGGPLGAIGVINELSGGEWIVSGPPEDNRET